MEKELLKCIKAIGFVMLIIVGIAWFCLMITTTCAIFLGDPPLWAVLLSYIPPFILAVIYIKGTTE